MMNTIQQQILNILPQQEWMSGTELMVHFSLNQRSFAMDRLKELVDSQQVQHRPWHEQGVSVPMFKRPVPEHGQISIF